MTTAAPTRPLEERFTERALAYMEDPRFPDELRSGLSYMVDGIIGDWSVWEEEDLGNRLGDSWMSPMDEAMEQIAWEEVRRSVVPAVARAAVEYLRQNPPPPHLPAHTESTVLREDLAVLEAGR